MEVVNNSDEDASISVSVYIDPNPASEYYQRSHPDGGFSDRLTPGETGTVVVKNRVFVGGNSCELTYMSYFRFYGP